MRVEIRPSQPEDFLELVGRLPPCRTMSLTATLGGRVLGIGGLVFAGGDVGAWVHMTDEARRFPFAIHRAGVAAIAMMRRARVRCVYASAQPDNPAAERWLKRLGFRRDAAESRFVWRPDVPDAR